MYKVRATRMDVHSSSRRLLYVHCIGVLLSLVLRYEHVNLIFNPNYIKLTVTLTITPTLPKLTYIPPIT